MAPRTPARRTLYVVALATVLVVAGAVSSVVWYRGAVPVQAGTPLVGSQPGADAQQVEELDMGEALEERTAPTVPSVQAASNDPPGWTRIPRPAAPAGPRRVGIQIGHWLTQSAPPELGRILQQTGGSWNGITEVQITTPIAERMKALLEANGIVVDILPTTVPPGYLADAFVSLHVDDDGTGAKSGFKLAHSARRTPHEDRLQTLLTEEYGKATGLEYDAAGVTRNMTGYYGFAWSRVRYATSPFTPSVIVELGFIGNGDDRSILMDQRNVVAQSLATGVLRFLSAVSRDDLFGKDLVVPPLRPTRPTPSPSAAP